MQDKSIAFSNTFLTCIKEQSVLKKDFFGIFWVAAKDKFYRTEIDEGSTKLFDL